MHESWLIALIRKEDLTLMFVVSSQRIHAPDEETTASLVVLGTRPLTRKAIMLGRCCHSIEISHLFSSCVSRAMNLCSSLFCFCNSFHWLFIALGLFLVQLRIIKSLTRAKLRRSRTNIKAFITLDQIPQGTVRVGQIDKFSLFLARRICLGTNSFIFFVDFRILVQYNLKAQIVHVLAGQNFLGFTKTIHEFLTELLLIKLLNVLKWLHGGLQLLTALLVVLYSVFQLLVVVIHPNGLEQGRIRLLAHKRGARQLLDGLVQSKVWRSHRRFAMLLSFDVWKPPLIVPQILQPRHMVHQIFLFLLELEVLLDHFQFVLIRLSLVKAPLHFGDISQYGFLFSLRARSKRPCGGQFDIFCTLSGDIQQLDNFIFFVDFVHHLLGQKHLFLHGLKIFLDLCLFRINLGTNILHELLRTLLLEIFVKCNRTKILLRGWKKLPFNIGHLDKRLRSSTVGFLLIYKLLRPIITTPFRLLGFITVHTLVDLFVKILFYGN